MMEVVEGCLSQMEITGLFIYLSCILLPRFSHSQNCYKIVCYCDKTKNEGAKATLLSD